MKRFSIISLLGFMLLWQIQLGITQVKITGKSTGTVTRTNTNAVDGKSTQEDGSNKIYVANPFYADQTLVVNSTTPTVAEYSAWKTANTNATAITTLNGISDSTYIKVVFIRIGDANTTFVHSEHFDCDGTNLAPASGDVVRCVWTGEAHPDGKWLVHKVDRYKFEDMVVEKGFLYDVTHPKYGAIPDDGLCDIDEIQVAIDSATANGGGTIFFPSGTYSFDGDNGHVRVFSNLTLEMYNAKMDMIVGGHPFFQVWGDSDIVFLGGEFDGNLANDGDYNQHNHVFDLIDGFRITMQDAYIHHIAGDGAYVADTDYVTFTNNIVIIDHISDDPFLGRNGIAVVEGDNIVISDNILEGGYPAGVDIEPNPSIITRNIVVSNNVIIGGDYGISIFIEADATARSDSTLIEGNYITNTNAYGIQIQGGKHWTIRGNDIKSSGSQGIFIQPGSWYGAIDNNDVYKSGRKGANGSGIDLQDSLYDISVTNNRSSHNRRDGIKIVGTSGNENRFITITGNICWNNDNLDSGQDGGIRVSYTDSSYIEDNYCYDRGTPKTQTYGFIFDNCDVNYFGAGNRGVGNVARLFAISSLTKERIGQSAAYSWILDDMAQGQTNQALKFAGGSNSDFVVPFDCQVVAMTLATSDTVTANNYTVTLVKNGTPTSFNDIVADGGDVRYAYSTLLQDSNAGLLLVAGDRVQLIYTSHAGMTPTGSLDVVATILVKY